jgi:hypothetical protein
MYRELDEHAIGVARAPAAGRHRPTYGRRGVANERGPATYGCTCPACRRVRGAASS